LAKYEKLASNCLVKQLGIPPLIVCIYVCVSAVHPVVV
jgi:hypothetical protein